MSKCPLAAGCLVLLAAALPAPAQEVRPVRVALRPAPAPSPALRYRLLPALSEKTPGNAVEHYRQAVAAMEAARKAAGGEDAPGKRIPAWLELAPSELPRDAVRKFLADYREVFPHLDRAARSDHCDWGLTDLARQQRYKLFSENQSLHELAGFLALRVRLEVAEGHADGAVRALQTGFAFARHVGESPAAAGLLAGAEIATTMVRELELLLAQEQAPSLYWALADLPRPFLDLRVPLQGERVRTYALFPGLLEAADDPNAGALKPEQVKAGVEALLRDFQGISKDFPTRAALTLWFRRKHDGSKVALVAAGRPRPKVEQMPHMQVALLHAMLQYDRLLDEMLKWQNFPDGEALAGVKQAERMVRQARVNALSLAPEVPALPLAPLMMPPYFRCFYVRARLDRQLAALRCVEAIRLYAAAHGGRLPATLADVKEAPVPADPFLGKPFAYRLDKGSATLEDPPPDGEEATDRNALRYELTLTN
jgi:hypothetical protein